MIPTPKTGSEQPVVEADSAQAEATQLRHRVQNVGWQFLSSQLAVVLDAADIGLLEMVGKASDASSRTTLFDTLRSLRCYRTEIINDWRYAWSMAFDVNWQLAARATACKTVSYRNIADDSALLAVRRRAEHGHMRQLESLGRSLVQCGIVASSTALPMAPVTLCTFWKESLSALEIGVEARLLMCGLFELHLVNELDSMYRTCESVIVSSQPKSNGVDPVAPAKSELKRQPPCDETANDETAKREQHVADARRRAEELFRIKTERAQAASKQWLVKTLATRRVSAAMRALICDGLQAAMIQAFLQGGTEGAPWQRIVDLIYRVLAWSDSSQAELPGAALCVPVRQVLREAHIEPPHINRLLAALERPGAAMRRESHETVLMQLAK